MEPIESYETSAYNNTVTPGTYPKEKKLLSTYLNLYFLFIRLENRVGFALIDGVWGLVRCSWELWRLDCSNWKSEAGRCTLLLVITPKHVAVTDVQRHSKYRSFSCCTRTAAPSHFTAGHNQMTFRTGSGPIITTVNWVRSLSQRCSQVPSLLVLEDRFERV